MTTVIRKFSVLILATLIMSCSKQEEVPSSTTNTPSISENGDYAGTGAVTQGLATTTTVNLFPQGQRVAGLGTITATDNSTWAVPADVNYANSSFPLAPDLYNPYGTKHVDAATANSNYDINDIVEIDANGEIITAYLFSDNYFELYVNGVPVGKDAVPFTDFNSHIVKFKANKPFTIAMKLVDWEENLGLGSEKQATDYHPGDGGMIAVFKDVSEAIIAASGSEWKAQTFYTAPIQDLSCPTENGTIRGTANCATSDATDGSNYYALHWEVPSDWTSVSFDDSGWPSATTYTSNELGMDNKSAYTSYLDVFNDAEFIWSTNVILDNEVIVRYTVK